MRPGVGGVSAIDACMLRVDACMGAWELPLVGGGGDGRQVAGADNMRSSR